MNYLTHTELKAYGSVKTPSERAAALVAHQRDHWSLAADNYGSLSLVETRTFDFGATTIVCQFNPGRIRSTGAKTDAHSIAVRPCFLCAANRPSEQGAIPFGRSYELLCNPFPIFPVHLTIPSHRHTAQLIHSRIPAFLRALKSLSDFVVFYNGPATGASAPDHFHFQAGSRGILPLERELESLSGDHVHLLRESGTIRIFSAEGVLRSMLVVKGSNPGEIVADLKQMIRFLTVNDLESEPKLNLLGWFEEENYTVVLFPRSAQRPSQYFAEGDDRILISPAAVELGGLVILPREEDFLKLKKEDLRSVFEQVSLNEAEFTQLKQRVLLWK